MNGESKNYGIPVQQEAEDASPRPVPDKLTMDLKSKQNKEGRTERSQLVLYRARGQWGQSLGQMAAISMSEACRTTT